MKFTIRCTSIYLLERGALVVVCDILIKKKINVFFSVTKRCVSSHLVVVLKRTRTQPRAVCCVRYYT